MGQFAYLEEQSGKMGLLCLQKASMFPSRGHFESRYNAPLSFHCIGSGSALPPIRRSIVVSIPSVTSRNRS
ncbi:hypothetical protein Hdeb2414_s0004g00146551 [Helianthus debilis subsp. tardiflorus]